MSITIERERERATLRRGELAYAHGEGKRDGMSKILSHTTRLAIEAIQKQIQRIAFDSNLFDRGLANYPYAENCSTKRKDLLAAIAELTQPTEFIQLIFSDPAPQAERAEPRTGEGE